jgi:agmatinase
MARENRADPPGFLEAKLGPDFRLPEPAACHLALIPYEETTTYRKGTRLAPEAVCDASGHMDLYDHVLDIDASKYGVKTLRPKITDLKSITRFARELRERHPDGLLGFIGGEHSITPALVEGCCPDDVGIVWIDAHADLRKTFKGSEDNHACAGYKSVRFGPIVQIGVRTLERDEADFIRSSDRVEYHSAWTHAARDAIRALPRNVYLTVDADGFSPELVRAVGTPEPGGLSWDDVVEIVEVLFEEKNVVAFDTVELCPIEDDVASTFVITKMVYKIISYHAHHNLRGR